MTDRDEILTELFRQCAAVLSQPVLSENLAVPDCHQRMQEPSALPRVPGNDTGRIPGNDCRLKRHGRERIWLGREIMALPEKYREVILLRYYQELTVKEIALLLHLPSTTVAGRLKRAKAMLKSALKEDFLMKLRDYIDRELADMTPNESILRDILKKDNKPFFLKPGLALCAALLALAFVIPVSANMFGPIGNTIRITDENRALLKQPDIAVSEEAPADTENHAAPSLLMEDWDRVSEAAAGIIREVEEGVFLPNTLTNIENHVFREGKVMRKQNFSYTLTAPRMASTILTASTAPPEKSISREEKFVSRIPDSAYTKSKEHYRRHSHAHTCRQLSLSFKPRRTAGHRLDTGKRCQSSVIRLRKVL